MHQIASQRIFISKHFRGGMPPDPPRGACLHRGHGPGEGPQVGEVTRFGWVIYMIGGQPCGVPHLHVNRPLLMLNLIDSNVDLFMYLIKGISFCTWKERRLNWATYEISRHKMKFPCEISCLQNENSCHYNEIRVIKISLRRSKISFFYRGALVSGFVNILVYFKKLANNFETAW